MPAWCVQRFPADHADDFANHITEAQGEKAT
jgi:hypothetical protein